METKSNTTQKLAETVAELNKLSRVAELGSDCAGDHPGLADAKYVFRTAFVDAMKETSPGMGQLAESIEKPLAVAFEKALATLGITGKLDLPAPKFVH